MAAGIWWPVQKLVWEALMSWDSPAVIIATLSLLVMIIILLVKLILNYASLQNNKLDRESFDRDLEKCQSSCQARIEGLREGNSQTISQIHGRIDANRTENQATLNTLISGMGELKGMISVLIENQRSK